jgi:hypothetical protein
MPRFALAALALPFLFSGAPAVAQSAKPQVAIVGVAHLVARRDIHNSTFADSPLSARRQTQIAEVVRHLARFHPTKVLVEAPMGDEKYQQQYRAYLAGKFALPADEVYQFGFRLAAASGNPKIYPIDTWGPPLIPDKSPEANDINRYLSAHFKETQTAPFEAYQAEDDRLERTGTYLDLLRYLNTDAAIEANASWYSVFAGAGRSSHDAGASYVAQWYVRNVYIYANLLHVLQPGDRAVVIFGQGHEYLLRAQVRLNPNLSDVDPLTYLSPNRQPSSTKAGRDAAANERRRPLQKAAALLEARPPAG